MVATGTIEVDSSISARDPFDQPVDDVPVRPRFVRECVLIPTTDGFLIDGGIGPRVIRTGTAKKSLIYLIDLLDGTRTLADLSAALCGVPFEDLKKTLLLLRQLGLLEEGSIGHPHTHIMSAATPYLRRFIHVNNRNRSASEALDRLQRMRVSVVSASRETQAAFWLRDLLLNDGVGSVVVSSLDELETRKPRGDSDVNLVLALSLTGEQHEWHRRLGRLCSLWKLPWLRVVVDTENNFADVGPLFNSAEVPCYECFWKVHGRGLSPASGASMPETALFIGLVAADIVSAFSEIASSGFLKGLRRYEIDSFRSHLLQQPRLPGCSACFPLPAAVGNQDLPIHDAAIDATVLYEEYVGSATKCRLFLEPQHGRTDNFASLIRQFKTLPNCKQIPLSQPDYRASQNALLVMNRNTPASRETMSLDELSLLLKLSGGIRSDDGPYSKLQRWAPTGGNLGSVELYVIALNVLNLAAGVYFYQSVDHRLASFQRLGGAVSPREFFQRAMRLESREEPDALIIMTGAYHRLSRKYGPFGYRLINFDAGVAVAQLAVAAASLGLQAQLARRWADDLIETQLGLASFDEQCTAVVALFSSGPRAANMSHPQYAGSADRSSQPRITYCGSKLQEIVELAYRSSRIKEHELDNRLESSVAGRQQPPLAGAATFFPNASAWGLPINTVLNGRRSIREYVPSSISLSEIGTILRFARETDPYWFEPGDLSLNILALRIEGLAKGFYSYSSAEESLHLEGPAPDDSVLSQLFVQSSLATAPALVLITGNLASATSRLGSYGHRLLLLRAGIQAQRLWISTMARGFGGAIVAGIARPVARKYLNMDGYFVVPLLAFALGIPSETKGSGFSRKLFGRNESNFRRGGDRS